MRIYSIMASPKSYPIYANTPKEALDKYREMHPEDNRKYFYTGAYHTLVVTKENQDINILED